MDGTRTQKAIITETAVHKGDLSTMVGKLESASLLVGDRKKPKLALYLPPNFFEAEPSTAS